MTDTAIEFAEMHYHHKSDWSFKKFHAVKGINLTVERGESFGFLGHNGAGKTTSIKCLLGLIRPSAGIVSIFGNNPALPEGRRSVGYVPERPYFYDHLKVREILGMFAALASVPRSRISSEIDRVLELVNLSWKENAPMRALSKGQTQRVAMAQAIIGSPELVILDEPFSGLDPLGRRELADLLVYLRESGTTIFMSSHVLSDIEFLCDRASIMVQGELKGVFNLSDMPEEYSHGHFELVVRDYQGIVSELREGAQEHVAQEVFLRLRYNDSQTAERALSIAINSDASISSYRFVRKSLEDIFVELVGRS